MVRGHGEIPLPRSDLIGRSPADRSPGPAHWTPPLVDVVDQLEVLAALLSSGVVSEEDFERQKRKVLGPRRQGAR
jgi:hypothetical protein